MVKKKGSLIIEFIFAFYILSLIINIVSVMLRGLRTLSFTNHTDFAYAIYSITKDINLSSKVDVEDDRIILYQNDNVFELVLHNSRLVKKPGFNIYLHNVDRVCFSYDENYVYMNIEREKQDETFTIGVYKRPTKRVCEPDGTDDVSNNDNVNCIDDNDVE